MPWNLEIFPTKKFNWWIMFLKICYHGIIRNRYELRRIVTRYWYVQLKMMQLAVFVLFCIDFLWTGFNMISFPTGRAPSIIQRDLSSLVLFIDLDYKNPVSNDYVQFWSVFAILITAGFGLKSWKHRSHTQTTRWPRFRIFTKNGNAVCRTEAIAMMM